MEVSHDEDAEESTIRGVVAEVAIDEPVTMVGQPLMRYLWISVRRGQRIDRIGSSWICPFSDRMYGRGLVVLVKDESGNYCICFDMRMASRAGLD